MGAVVPLSCHVILHRFLRPSPLLSFSLFKQSAPLSLQTTPFRITLPAIPSPCSLCSISSTPNCSLSSSQALLEPRNDAVQYDGNSDNDDPENDAVVEGLEGVLDADAKENDNARNDEVAKNVKLPSLSTKEKKELASYAHSLGKRLKSQQIGKSGVTGTVITALVETLEANELLKVKIHGNCPAELDDAVKQVQEGTGSVVVGQIGRTVILYRPSLSKLKAEMKKKQSQRFFARKQFASKPSLQQSKGQIPRQSGRGRRGSSRA